MYGDGSDGDGVKIEFDVVHDIELNDRVPDTIVFLTRSCSWHDRVFDDLNLKEKALAVCYRGNIS